jgi:type I restriction enzyme, S subunit
LDRRPGGWGVKRKPYPAYKPSGVEWLGKVPEHWEVKRLRHCASIAQGQVDPEAESYVDMPLIAPNHIDSGTGKLIQLETAREQAAESGKYHCLKGCVVYSKIRPFLRKACLAPEDCLCSADIYPLYGKSGFENNFLLWFILSDIFSSWAVLESDRVAMPKINREKLKEVCVTSPPVPEQQAIATFLDHETGKIDTLIGKKQRLIELLKEKRTALISRAVTKGLDPAAPMKPSGVEWLGDVPERWRVKKTKYVSKQIIDGTHVTPTYVDDGIPFLRVTDIQNRKILIDDVKLIPVEEHTELIKRCRPRKNDILLSKNGTVGITKVVDWDWEFSIFVSLCLIKLNRSYVNPHFFCYQFSSEAVFQQIVEGTKQTSVINLHLDKIKELLVILPPLSEQQAIVDYLDREAGKIDVLIAKVEMVIEKLKEYRIALISAAVTGKIDVREAS